VAAVIELVAVGVVDLEAFLRAQQLSMHIDDAALIALDGDAASGVSIVQVPAMLR
jgi:hypothetical protein